MRISLLILFLAIASALHGQNAECRKQFAFRSIEISTNTHTLIPHHDTLATLRNGYFYGLELRVGYTTTGSKPWHALYNFPQVGISAKLFNLHDRNKLGHAIGITHYISFQPIRTKQIHVNIGIDAGLAYITKKYHPTQNPSNVAISTSINFLGSVGFQFGYNITSNTSILLNLKANHISNGCINKPNYGLNFIGFGVGISQNITNNSHSESPEHNTINRKNHIRISFLGGVKEAGGGSSKFYTVTTQISATKPVTNAIELGGSLDLMLDQSAQHYIEEKKLNYSWPKNAINIGLATRVELPFDRITGYGEFGVYLNKQNPHYKRVYQRLGLLYRLTPRLFASIGLKTHGTMADHINSGFTVLL